MPEGVIRGHIFHDDDGRPYGCSVCLRLLKKKNKETLIDKIVDESYTLSGECKTASQHHLKLIKFLRKLR